MTLTARVAVALNVAWAGAAGAAELASDAGGANRAVLDELAAMRREVAALRRAHDEEWLSDARAQVVRAVVSDALADASTRAQHMGSEGALVTGYDTGRGFYLGSPETGNSMRVFGFTQVRFIVNNGWNAAERSPSSDTVWGGEIRRAQLFATGNIDGPSLSWLIGLSIGAWNDPTDLQTVEANPQSVNGTPPSISYLSVTQQLGNGWYLQAGSIFTPFTYESHLFSTAQTQMGECTMIEWLFTAAFTTGVSVGVNGETVRWQACAGNQIGTAPGSWNSNENQSLAAAARINWKLAGNWEQYALESSFPEQEFGAFLGIGGRLQNGRAMNTGAGTGSNPSAVTADLALMFGGANLVFQGVWADQWTSNSDNSWGGLVQAGYFLGPAVEAFGVLAFADVASTQGRLTTGINWYINRESLKLTVAAVIPLLGNPENFTSAVLPPQGLGGGDHPNNNASLLIQLQASF